MGLFQGSWSLSVVCVGAQVFAGGGVPFSAVEIAELCGIDARYTGPSNGLPTNVMICGAAAEDFNRDGWIDLYILGGAQQRDFLYICIGPDQNGVIQYEDQSEAWGIQSPQSGAGVSVADYDNNGYLDLYVTALSNEGGSSMPGQHRLYRNMGPDKFGQFRFEQVAEQAGVAFTSESIGDGYSSSWGDIDRDGDLDLMVGGWTENSGGNTLFRNNSDGTFTDITQSSIDIDLFDTHGFTPRFVDITGDGAVDLLIAADYNTSKLLINDGMGNFTDITKSAGVNQDSNGMGATTADFNNDGLIDWYVSSIKSGISPTRNGNKLYMNLGGGVFEETAISAGVDDGGWGWGVAAGDLDHDGDLDIVETNGWLGGQWFGEQSYIFLNNGDATAFTERALEIGVNHTGQGRGTMLFDHDNDGDLDLAFVSSDVKFALFRNDAPSKSTNHWVQMRFDTMSSPSNAPDGVGAHVVITAGDTVQHRWVQANSGYLSQGPIMVHAGLGDAAVIDRVEIRWANGGVRIIENLDADALYTFTPCDGDMNGDHLVEMLDVSLFIDAFVNGQRHTDLDANGVHNIFDVFAFFDAYNAGCPDDG